VGIEPTPDGGGYWLATSNGAALDFGDAFAFAKVTPTAPVSGISG
jgi:hypothetical protein